MANRSEQLRPTRCVVLCGNLHPCVLRDSLPIVQVGGGIVLVAMGWAILLQRDEGCDAANRKNIHPQDAVREVFYPLTLPLTVGPGSISVTITLGANAAHSLALHALTILAALVGSALIALSIFLCYGFAD
jgi:multiple antibiotic resistance protein